MSKQTIAGRGVAGSSKAAQISAQKASGERGQFGELAKAGNAQVDLADGSVAEVIRAAQVSEGEAFEAVAETSTTADAIRWARHASEVRDLHELARKTLEQVKADEVVVADSSIQASVKRILMSYPDANHLEVVDRDGDGNFEWLTFVNGEEQELPEELTDELWDLSCPINHRMPRLFEKWSAGFEMDRHTSTLDRAVINLDLFR